MSTMKPPQGTGASSLRSRRLLLEDLEERLAPAVFNVTSAAMDGAAGSLRYAIGQANTNSDPSNTINLAAGVYNLAASSSGELLIRDLAAGVAGKTLTIAGQSEASTFVQSKAFSAQGSRLFEIVGGNGIGETVRLENLTLRSGFTQNGGLLGGTAALGGGLLVEGGDVTLSRVAVSDNSRVRCVDELASWRYRRKCNGRRNLPGFGHAHDRQLERC